MAQPRETQADRLKRIEAENAKLRKELSAAQTALEAQPAAVEAAPREKRRYGRGIGAVALIVIAGLLTPVAVVANTVQAQLTNTDLFVTTVSSSLDDPKVQDFLTTKIVDAIEEKANLDQLTSDLFTGLKQLDLPPKAAAALGLLEGPAAAGLHSLLTTAVDRVVTSDEFQTIIEQALRLTHEQLILALSGSSEGAVTIDESGVVSLQLGVIIDAVKEQLADTTPQLAALIPTGINKTIPIAQSDEIARAATAYQLAVVLGTWLPWLVLALFAGGVLLARRRSVALFAAGVTLAAVSAVLLVGIAVGRYALSSMLAPNVPIGVGGVIYDSLVASTLDYIVLILVLGLTVAVIAAIAAPWRGSRAVRGGFDRLADAGRESAEKHNVTTGRFGEFLGRWRVAIRVIIAVAAAAILFFNRPLTPNFVVWTAVIALLIVVVLRLLERPVTREVETASAEAVAVP